MQSVRVWDLPLRLFHWLLALSVTANLLLAHFGEDLNDAMLWHTRLGYLTLGLLIFRLIWGFAGGTHARFANFVRGPGSVVRYLKTQKNDHPGHNPLGALSVIALLASCLFQAVSGLFVTDEIMTEGPLFKHVSEDTANLLAQLHEWNGKLIIVLLILHLAAIAYYQFIKRDKLVMPMITGNRQVPADANMQSAQGGGLGLGLVIAAIAAAVVWYVVNKI